MPVNFTRRVDLFRDAGFQNPLQADTRLQKAAKKWDVLSLLSQGQEEKLFCQIKKQAEEHVSPELKRIISIAPQWLEEKNGDLASLLWLSLTFHGEENSFPIGPFLLGFAAHLGRSGKKKEALALFHFLVKSAPRFVELYEEPDIAYEFFQTRDPNPFVWKVLKFLEQRTVAGVVDYKDSHVLELGCGIGNDAVGFLQHPYIKSYTGLDVSTKATTLHRQRVKPYLQKRPEVSYEVLPEDFATYLKRQPSLPKHPYDLIYSYSSLHYFSSLELKEIFQCIGSILEPGKGLFCFAIKGKGSVWDGKGIPLYRPDVWINLDGQSRWFPSTLAVKRLLDTMEFECLLHERHEHWGYSETGERDFFHYVIASPR